MDRAYIITGAAGLLICVVGIVAAPPPIYLIGLIGGVAISICVAEIARALREREPMP